MTQSSLSWLVCYGGEEPKAPPHKLPLPVMILKRLRQETLQHHDQLERQSPLLSSQLTLAGYHQLLLRFYGYYKPLEERLTKSVRREAAFFDQNGRRKSQFLEQDLAALNHGATDGLKQVPRCENLPLLENIPQLLGCLYVLEGATLDGQKITAHLQTHLGLTPQSGTAFFHGYGLETMRPMADLWGRPGGRSAKSGCRR